MTDTSALPSADGPPPEEPSRPKKSKRRPIPPPRSRTRKKFKGSAKLDRQGVAVVSQPVSTGSTFQLRSEQILSAFQQIQNNCDDVHDRWYSAADWCQILRGKSSFINSCGDSLSSRKLTCALNKGYRGGIQNNIHGVYSNQFGSNKAWFYLVTTPGAPCPNPPSATALCISRYTPPRTRAQIAQTPVLSPAESTPARPPHSSAINAPSITPTSDASPSPTAATPTELTYSAAELREHDYFHSTEAFYLFMPAGFDPEDFDHLHINARRNIVIQTIQKRIKALEGGISEWWTVVKNGKEGDPITWHERLTVQ